MRGSVERGARGRERRALVSRLRNLSTKSRGGARPGTVAAGGRRGQEPSVSWPHRRRHIRLRHSVFRGERPSPARLPVTELLRRDSERAPGPYRASDFSPVVSFRNVARTLLAGPATTTWQYARVPGKIVFEVAVVV